MFCASPSDWFFSCVQAEDTVDKNKYYSLNIDQPTIAKGYTVSAFDKLKLSLVPGILSEATNVDVVELAEEHVLPWSLDLISNIYQFEFRNKAAYDDHNPFYIQFSYEQIDNNYKKVFFYDKNYDTWRPLPTVDFPKEQFVRSLIHLPYARIAVFSYPSILSVGRASWYAYKPGNFAASPDFPKGSILRVTNLENNKFVDVKINDYGPERDLFPDRVIDLEKNAFAAIADLGQGVTEISIAPLFVPGEELGAVLGVTPTGVGAEPAISAKSAIIINENDGKVLWSKNATTTRPLASLTKLVAVKVFLETRPSLNREVTYSIKDEEYNYEHVNKWESASLNIDEGETLTIEDLLYTSLVGSANNTIESLVRVSTYSRDEFIAKMNTAVRLWGATNTSFIEPTGLAPENVSSATDYAIISKEVLKNPIIAKASTQAEYKFTTINTKKPHRIRNTNHIIKTNQFHISGSKTGYLHEAGYCLMTRAKISPWQSIIVVTLGADTRDTSFFETTSLMRYGERIIKIQ